MSKIPFKDYIMVDTAGLSSFYANDGGIIVAYWYVLVKEKSSR